MHETNKPLLFNELAELSLRDKVLLRLVSEHDDMNEKQYRRWVELLNDPDPRGRAMSVTAALTMMDVRDGSDALMARQRFDLLRKDV